MISPLSIVNQQQIKPRESPQNYALRLLNTALLYWTQGLFDQAIQIVEDELAKHELRTSDTHDKRHEETGAIDALANVEIELRQMKAMHRDILGKK